MKFHFNFFLLALFAALCLAANSHKQIIVSYPENTPYSVLEEAKAAIEKAGGVVEHEYTLIKGFVAKVSAKAMEEVQALGSKHNVLVEEDQTVHIQDS